LLPGSGAVGAEASLKVLLHYEYIQSRIEVLSLRPGHCSDQGQAQLVAEAVGPGELALMDKGFFSGAALQALAERGGFYVIPWPRSVAVQQPTPSGALAEVDVANLLRHHPENRFELAGLTLGKTAATQLKGVRLVAFRLSPESASRHRAALREKYRTKGKTPTAVALELAGWLILLTNAPAAQLPAAALSYVYRLRWQIELVFKQYKSVLGLDLIQSEKSERVLCEVWARLLAGLIVLLWHGPTNAVCWAQHGREISFHKLALRLQQEGQALARALFEGGAALRQALLILWRLILKLARKEHQPSRKTTWQNLQEHWLEVAAA